MSEYRKELIQVAAVAVAMITDLDHGNTDTTAIRTINILEDIHDERDRQELKWGAQHHSKEKWLTILTEEVGEVARAILDNK